MIVPDVSDRTVLVTGSARGLGREILIATAHHGASTAVHYHTSKAAAIEVETAAERAGAADTAVVHGDVTDPAAVDALFDAVESTLGPVDVLVNNVGDFDPVHWAEMSVDRWQRVIDTNLTATYLCSKRSLEPMRERAFGRIVNIGYASSDRGLVNPKNAPYFIAKTGVLMFTRMLAADTRDDGITVNAVSPYVIENSETFPEDLPRDRPATFEDVVQAVFTFLEADSEYLSGANIEVDGGWLPEEV